MDEIRLDVIQQALIVGDEQNGAVRAAQAVGAVGDDFQGVDVQAGIGFIHQRQPRIAHRHLENFVALLFPAGEAFVDGTIHETLVHLQQGHLLP